MSFQAYVDKVGDWPGYLSAVQALPGRWLFRGVLEHWEPETSLERACLAWSIPLSRAGDAERRLVREFRRHPEARQVVGDEEDYLGCLAVMQHHGAPTRLLDWTYSPYVAGYFAFEALVNQREPSKYQPSVWALNVDWLSHRLEAFLGPTDWNTLQSKKDDASFVELFVSRDPPRAFISTATPLMLNQRLSIQQGVFLCPGNVTLPWIDNLKSLGWSGDRSTSRAFVMEAATMPTAFEQLQKMNVTARSLFPGLDGYAKSMLQRFAQLLEYPLPRV